MSTPERESDPLHAPAIRVSGARKTYLAQGRPVHALIEVNVSVLPGELAVILGPNGSGKSTLLRAMGGLVRLDAGKVELAGRDILALSPRNLATSRGVLQQHPRRNLCQGFTVAEMFALYADGSTRFSASEAHGTLQRIGVSLDRLAGTLSGGQQQLLALELLLARSPQTILLDEPTAALDPQNAAIVRERLRQTHRNHLAMVLVSHNIDEAIRLADRLLFLHEGNLVRSWQGEELASLTPEAVRDFAYKIDEAGRGSASFGGKAEG